MKINLLPKKRKVWQVTYKTLHITASLALIFNMSMLGVFLNPNEAQAGPSTAYCPSGNPLYMWNRIPSTSTGWSHGNIKGYFEGEYIPVELVLNGLTASSTYNIVVSHDYKNSGVVGIETFEHVNAPIEPGVSLSNQLNFSIINSTVAPDQSKISYTFEFTTPATGTTANLYWDALLGPNAHTYPGASLHINLEGCGNKDVPINVNQILYHDLSIEKFDNPDPILINTNTTYTVTAYNDGKTDGGETNFTITDTLPAGMTYDNNATPAPTSVAGNVITWNFGTVADDDSRTATYEATGVAVGTHDNTAVLTTDGSEPVETVEPTTVYGECNLVVTKDVDKLTAVPGETLTYTLYYENTGTAVCTGTGVRIQDILDPMLTYIDDPANHDESVSNDTDQEGISYGWHNIPGYDSTTRTITWNANKVSPGESGIITFEATVNTPEVCGDFDIPNQATIWSNETDTISSNTVNTHVDMICPGSITVVKNVIPNDSSLWDFNLTGPTPDSVNLGDSEFYTFNDRMPGIYDLTETISPDYTYGVSCGCKTINYIPNGVSFELMENEHVTCTFTNTRNTGNLLIIKQDEQQQRQTDVEFDIDGNTYYTDGNGEIYLPNIDTDDYNVLETEPSNYSFLNVSGINCTNSNPSTATVVKDDTTTCTFTNTRNTGWLKVIKEVINDNGGNATAANFNVHVKDGGIDVAGSPAPGSATGTTYELVTGTYTVSEDFPLPNGYTQTNIVCDGQQTSTVIVETGVTKVCTITNDDDAAHLTLEKFVENNDGGTALETDWLLSATGPTTISDYGYVDSDVSAGTYTLSESGPTNYSPSAWVCDGGIQTGDQIELALGESTYCWITNDDIPAHLTLVKEVVNVHGSTAAATDWTLSAAGPTPISGPGGADSDVNAGTYTLSETGPANYTPSAWVCVGDGIQNGNEITVGLNESATCTITNTRNIGTIKVNKEVDTNGDGTFEGGNVEANALGFYWGIDAVPPAHAMGSSENVVTGNYDITENINDVAGYHFVGWYYSDDSCSSCETTPNTSLPVNIDVTQGNTTEITLCNARDTGNITGKKYEDLNSNGQWDTGEPFVPGVTINLSNGDSTTTDQNGSYAFNDLPTGQYTVSEVVPAGWINTTPTSYPATVTKGTTLGIWFGNFDKMTMSGMKFEDIDGDGDVIESGPGIENWPIYLYEKIGITWTLVQTELTDVNGNYSFEIDHAGQYKVVEDTSDTNWIATTTTFYGSYNITSGYSNIIGLDFGNFNLVDVTLCKYEDADGDINTTGDQTPILGWELWLEKNGSYLSGAGAEEDGCYTWTNLGPGEYEGFEQTPPTWTPLTPTSHDFGVVTSGNTYDYTFINFENVNITVNKLIDADGDLHTTGDQTVKAGWEVELWKNGSYVETQYTNAGGSYTWTNLSYGTYKAVEIFDANEYTALTPTFYEFAVTSGTDVNKTFINFENVDIKVFKFMDADGSNCTTNDRTAKEGWTVQLWKDVNQIGTDQLTESDGSYTWPNLGPGTYTVKEIFDANEYTAITLTEYTFTVTSRTNVSKIFVNFEYGTINGHKYDDQQNALANWEICLNVDTCTHTDENGYYEFTQLFAGTYNVAETQQNGWTVISPATGEYTDVSITSGVVVSLDFINQLNKFEVDIVKTAPATVDAGDQMTYTLDWSITGNTPIFNAYVSDVLPANTTFVSPPTGVYDSNTNTITWDLGTVNPNDSGTVTFVVAVASPLDNNTIIENTGEVCGTGYIVPEGENELFNIDGTTKCDSDTTTTTVESKPILGIEKTNDVTGPLNPGDQVNYTVYWSVDGNSKATNVTLIDTIPAELTVDVDSISNGGVYDEAIRAITWDLGTQVPHAEGFVTYSGLIITPLADGTTIVNVAKITSNETDPLFWEDDSVVVVESAPILTIDKVVNKEWVNPGDEVTYTVVISNVGTETAYNVELTDLLPLGFTYSEFFTNVYTWQLGDLAAGENITITYNVTVGEDVTAGSYENLAVAYADNHGNVSDKVPVEVRVPKTEGEEALPELVITKTVFTGDQEFINPGGSVVYTVKVENVGDAPAINVQLQDIMPAGFTFEDGEVTKIWMLGDIAEGEFVEISYKANGDETLIPGTYENLAVAWADNHDKVTDSVKVEVRAPVVLGEELPTTGGGIMYWLYFIAAGFIIIFSAWVFKLTSSKKRS